MWDLHRMSLLLELQRRGTVTAVAEALSYSPSSVSQQLAKLEREVGTPLLERDGRRLRLTEAGTAVAEHAARVRGMEERLRGTLEHEATALTGTIRIAALETAMHWLLPAAIRALATEHPLLRIEAEVAPPELGLTELITGRFDLAMAEQYPGHGRHLDPELDRVPFGLDPIRLVVPSASQIESLPSASTAAWITEPMDTATTAWLIQQCRSAGFEPDIRYLSTQLSNHLSLVASGLAVTLLPDLVRSDGAPEVRRIPLTDSPHRELFTATRTSAADRPAIRAIRAALSSAFQRTVA